MKRLFAVLGLLAAWPLMAQDYKPIGPPDEILGPGKGETIRLGFGLNGGYLMSKKLVGGGAGGANGVMTIGSFWEPASVIISAGAYAGNGNMGAMLNFAARQHLYRSQGGAFFMYTGVGFGLHATPTFFASDSYDMSGLAAAFFLQTGAERTVTEEVSLTLNVEYGITNAPGTPNYFQASAGFLIYGR